LPGGISIVVHGSFLRVSRSRSRLSEAPPNADARPGEVCKKAGRPRKPPVYFRKPSTLRSRQAQARCVPQLRRFRVGTRSTRHDRVLLCRDAFTAYCGTGSVPKGRAPVCWSRVHPKASAVSADDKIVENGAQAGRVSRLGSNLSLTSPLLRIGDPSPVLALWCYVLPLLLVRLVLLTVSATTAGLCTPL
jgi:hypothetical protein